MSPITLNATIASGASLSDAITPPPDRVLIGIVMPGTWTAANLTFQGAPDNSTYNNVYDDGGTELTAVAAASRYIALNHRYFFGLAGIKVRSGTSGTPVNQGGARTIGLVFA